MVPVILLAFFGALFRAVVATIKYRMWRRKGTVVANVKQLKDKKIEFKKKSDSIEYVEYIYILSIDDGNEKFEVEYTEIVDGDMLSTIHPNDKIVCFVNRAKKQIKRVDDMKNEIKSQLYEAGYTMLMIIVLFIVLIAWDAEFNS